MNYELNIILRPFMLQGHVKCIDALSNRTRKYCRKSPFLFSLFLYSVLLLSIIMSQYFLRLPLPHQISQDPENQNLCHWDRLQMGLLPVKQTNKKDIPLNILSKKELIF